MGRYYDLSSGPSPNHGENFSRWRLLHLGRDQLSGFTDQLPGVSSTKLSRITQAGRGTSVRLAASLGGVANTLDCMHREWSFPIPFPSAQKLLKPKAVKRFFRTLLLLAQHDVSPVVQVRFK